MISIFNLFGTFYVFKKKTIEMKQIQCTPQENKTHDYPGHPHSHTGLRNKEVSVQSHCGALP